MTHAPGSIRRRTLTGGLLVALLCMSAMGGAADLDVRIVDDRISISASAVPLAELLAALDAVAGTESSVAIELRNRNVSVQFSGLSLDNAVDKVFEGLGLDFLVVGGRRIMVTAVSGGPDGVTRGFSNAAVTAGTSTPARPAAPAPAVNPFQLQGFQGQAAPQRGAQPGVNPFGVPGQAAPQGGVQPRVIQTPFGPIAAPERETPSPNGGPTGVPGFRAPETPDSRTNLFGNTSPRMLDLNKQQPDIPSPAPAPTVPTSPANSPFPAPR